MDIRLNSDHDIDIENGEIFLTSGIDAIRQDLDIALQFFQAEWFLDTCLGVPYWQKLLGHKPRLNVIAQIFRDAVLAVNGVQSITELLVDYDSSTRTVSVSFVASTADGPITYSKELIV